MKTFLAVLAAIAPLLFPAAARAHFQMLIPSADVVGTEDARTIRLDLLFTHPMEQQMMDMARPVGFGVCIRGGKPVGLLPALEKQSIDGKTAWQAPYVLKRPGDHVFFVEPAPYWEPAEGKFIIHYTKVVVNAFGNEEGWDHEVGLKTEIVPLARPYGLWAGNVFRGVVKLDGHPVPFAELEVEYYNEPGRPPVKAPTDAHITQVIKADANGTFAYAMPKAGWWGFAALNDADYTIKGEDGEDHGVELGAVIWVRTYEMK